MFLIFFCLLSAHIFTAWVNCFCQLNFFLLFWGLDYWKVCCAYKKLVKWFTHTLINIAHLNSFIMTFTAICMWDSILYYCVLSLNWEKKKKTFQPVLTETSVKKDYPSDSLVEKEGNESSSRQARSTERRYKEYIFGEEAMKISPTEPYCLRRPIRRGHLNISQHYPLQQVPSYCYFLHSMSCRSIRYLQQLGTA